MPINLNITQERGALRGINGTRDARFYWLRRVKRTLNVDTKQQNPCLDQSPTLTAGPMVRDDGMRPYRFNGLVQGGLLQLHLAIFILVKVIPALSDTHLKKKKAHFTYMTTFFSLLSGITERFV